MSINSISGGAAAYWRPQAQEANPAFDPVQPSGPTSAAAGMDPSKPHSSSGVSLQNGLSVGVVSFGKGGLSDRTMQTLQDIASRFAFYETPRTQAESAAAYAANAELAAQSSKDESVAVSS